MSRLVAVTVVIASHAGCVSETVYPPAPDAWVRPEPWEQPLLLLVQFRGGEPASRPPPIPLPGGPPVVEASWSETGEHNRHVVLRGNGMELRTIDVLDSDGLCVERHERGQPPRRFWQTICLLWSGDLRLARARDDDGGWMCDEPMICPAACGAHAPCGAGQRCTSRRTTPISTHMACAPIGPRSEGETCSLVQDPAGAYDDCGDGLLCERGVCQRLCSLAECSVAGPACQYIHGQPPELRFCL